MNIADVFFVVCPCESITGSQHAGISSQGLSKATSKWFTVESIDCRAESVKVRRIVVDDRMKCKVVRVRRRRRTRTGE